MADVKVLMNHPMETGNRKDAKTGQMIPLHFIRQVTASLNGTVVYEVQWSQAISKNPYLGFRLRGVKAGDRLAVAWLDNTGDKNAVETVIVSN